jgi:3-deoxy-7-phosphoheptulonate synthase
MSATAGTPSTQNLNVVSVKPIVTPSQLERDLPASAQALASVRAGRDTIRRILRREDPRLLVVVGPCSVHDVAAAREYASRLVELRNRVKDRYEVVMRVYFEKPRTTVGWKGLINDPHLDGSFDMNVGLKLARKLLRDVCELGLPTATELLDPIVPQYIDDLVSWAAIGARTTESQTHRQMASGLSMPVGYKNSTDGNLQVAIDAFRAAMSPHHFLGIDENGVTCIVSTRGNTDGHIILRGGGQASASGGQASDGGGKSTNYEPAAIRAAADKLAASKLPPVVMVDCSHANSGKKHENQSTVWQSVLKQRAESKACPIVGVMIESNLVEGAQPISDNPTKLVYGKSITDACIGWDETVRMLEMR